MKKLVCGFIGSFIVLFFIWTLIAWITYPDFISNASHYHLNLYGMLQRFNFSPNQSSDLISTFQSFISSLRKINVDNPIVSAFGNAFNTGGYEPGNVALVLISLVNSLINPIISIANVAVITGYLIVILAQFLAITTGLAAAIFSFIFEPLFIYV